MALTKTDLLPTLDGWRAIAILGVLFAHGASIPFAQHFAQSPFWSRLPEFGALGVPVFFGISGYLITHRLVMEEEGSGSIDLVAFYTRRAFRILPPYFTYLLILTTFGVPGVFLRSGNELLSCIAFVRNYLTPASSGGWYTSHFWSLAIEEHFYLLWPFLFVITTAPRRPGVAAAIALAVAFWRWLNIRFGLVPAWASEMTFSFRSDIRLDALFLGAAAAVAQQQFRPCRPFQWFITRKGWCLAGLLFIFSAQRKLRIHSPATP